eukprot:2299932-Pleurochrysis_carterae.AAC.2
MQRIAACHCNAPHACHRSELLATGRALMPLLFTSMHPSSDYLGTKVNSKQHEPVSAQALDMHRQKSIKTDDDRDASLTCKTRFARKSRSANPEGPMHARASPRAHSLASAHALTAAASSQHAQRQLQC